jgi:RHS repeat-associated protein
MEERINPDLFTGKERDAETGLDYFGARYYAAPMGRFTGPDAPFADQHIANPQSWNLFAYTANNPLRFIDDQ